MIEMRDCHPFLKPKSVAIVGASERKTSSGGAVLRNLILTKYPGKIIPVNPSGGKVLGIKCSKSLLELKKPVELVVIVVRPDLILNIVDEAIASGHKNLMILPGGFSEAGTEGQIREKELLRKTNAAGITVFGPNSAGCIHLNDKSPFAATFLRDLPLGGKIALISQSGAISEEIIATGNKNNLPISTVISVGNSIHLEITNYLEYLGEYEDCNCILLYIESINNTKHFSEIASKVARKKPIVALIGGRTPEGSNAVINHTGGSSMTDDQASLFMKDCGVIRVKSLRQLMLAAKGFGFFPQGIGKRILLLSNSGGPGVITTDRLIDSKLEMPPLPENYSLDLKKYLPLEAAIANPVDMLADAREDRFEATFNSALKYCKNAYDAVLMIHVVPFMVDANPIIKVMSRLAEKTSFSIFHSMMGTLENKNEWFQTMEDSGVAMFENSEDMAESAGILAQYPPLQRNLEKNI
ncbi:MAG: CoA-binding protein [Alphaproteobacteria bacterium]|jgi:acetyltransferase|nr:CoA-binding protein [Alphaproteobacteria bacterium]